MDFFSYAEAQALGMTSIVTGNHANNVPMLAVNHKLGFVADPPIVFYSRALLYLPWR